MAPVEMINHPAAIAESSDDVVYCKSLDAVILTWSAADEKLYGYTADEIASGTLPPAIDDQPG